MRAVRISLHPQNNQARAKTINCYVSRDTKRYVVTRMRGSLRPAVYGYPLADLRRGFSAGFRGVDLAAGFFSPLLSILLTGISTASRQSRSSPYRSRVEARNKWIM